jgi:hypothetical protein
VTPSSYFLSRAESSGVEFKLSVAMVVKVGVTGASAIALRLMVPKVYVISESCDSTLCARIHPSCSIGLVRGTTQAMTACQ